eukprot:TRINITY_DN20874_c0_g1_i2.p1 TRINITY_DN20874_c0_g1~~TRINITY_DN20874_c0_g1_i2.p1  ORF type:complete len:187 (+),score=27.32 TRINITY_DN20874_c0_g1_i2:129-689(+)
MVWDLRHGPMQMDYSHLNPDGRKRVTPDADTTPHLRFGPRSTAQWQPSPTMRAAMAAVEAAKRARSAPHSGGGGGGSFEASPSSPRDAASDGRKRANPFTQPRRESTSSREGKGKKEKALRTVRFDDQSTCAAALKQGSPPLPTAPKPLERFVRWRHQSLRRSSSADMETGRRAGLAVTKGSDGVR